MGSLKRWKRMPQVDTFRILGRDPVQMCAVPSREAVRQEREKPAEKRRSNRDHRFNPTRERFHTSNSVYGSFYDDNYKINPKFYSQSRLYPKGVGLRFLIELPRIIFWFTSCISKIFSNVP